MAWKKNWLIGLTVYKACANFGASQLYFTLYRLTFVEEISLNAIYWPQYMRENLENSQHILIALRNISSH